jgi:hypothetical protein
VTRKRELITRFGPLLFFWRVSAVQRVEDGGSGFDRAVDFLGRRTDFDDAASGPESVKERLRSELEGGSQQVRWRAARALGEMKDMSSVPLLALALGDESPVVRWVAAEALGEIGGRRAVEALLAALDDESRQVQKGVATALIALVGVPGPDPANLEFLLKLLSSGDDRVAASLVRMGSLAEGVLTERLEDDSFFVRRDAARVLARCIRTEMDDHFWKSCSAMDPAKVASLYRFRTTVDGSGLVRRVEYTGFDAISELILGKEEIFFSPLFTHEVSVPGELDSREISLEDILGPKSGLLKRVGRTLIHSHDEVVLAIKLGLGPEEGRRLLVEVAMQDRLGRLKEDLGLESSIPRPIAPDGDGFLFRLRLSSLPRRVREDLNLFSDPVAICYSPPSGYFTYLNDPGLSSDSVSEGLTRSAHDLAILARSGFVHDALIPLFHNREQVGRRGDRGVYRWWSMIPGRLDRWFESCRYPNLRLSGIADFEHFRQFAAISAQDLQHLIGDQLLSISLVLASHFRSLGGVRDDLVTEALRSVFEAYCLAFVSRKSSSRSVLRSETALSGCVDWDLLASRMREEMGGERYMRGLVRGGGPDGSDLEVENGPHLGLFGGYFPLPELVRAIHLATTFAILEGFG